MTKTIFSLFIVFFSPGLLLAQISAYGSTSYGYNSNPLYNYEKLSDQLFQTYVEVTSDHSLERSDLKFQYVGGSMIFHRFTLRNYYEHSLALHYDTKLFRSSAPIHEDEEEGEDESDPEESDDSTGISFHTDVQVSARHDKKEFKEFDNEGLISNNRLSFNIGEGFSADINSKTEYRYYQNLHPYNNLSEIFTLDLKNGNSGPFQYGLSLSGGLKYFSKIKYDTSLFEETRSYVVQMIRDSNFVGSGKQGRWVYYTYPDTSESEKIVLQRPDSKTTYQISAGGFILRNWENGSFRIECVYRINSRSTLLTLVQSSSTLTLNEDLYNSVFNAHGPELRLLLSSTLPSAIQFSANITADKKTYETPAYDLLSGQRKTTDRKDIGTNIEVNASRFFQVTETVGFDISVNINYLRNSSNDAYNDYSLFGYSLSFGCAF